MTPEGKDPVIEQIQKCVINLLFNQPFFGNMATRFNVVEDNKNVSTLGIDGRNIYYNRDYIKNLTPRRLVFDIGHLVLHAVYDHIGRGGSRDPGLWGMAIDYSVNYVLVKNKIGDAPKNVLFDERFNDDLSAEEIYQILKKERVTIKIPIDTHFDLKGGSYDENSDGKSNSKNGNEPGDEDGGGGGKGLINVNIDGVGGMPYMTDEEIKNMRAEVRNSMVSAMQSAQKAGMMPLGLTRKIRELTNPLMDWSQLVQKFVLSYIKNDYDYTKPSKRSWSLTRGLKIGELGKNMDFFNYLILPGSKKQKKISVMISIDTSGSMTDEMIRDFLSEVKGIMETFKDFELWLWTFDTQVYNPQLFTRTNKEDIMTYEVKGGGGTTFETNWEFMKNPKKFFKEFPLDKMEPDKFIMFTDGYPCGTWGDSDFCDTLFVVHGNQRIVAPFGSTAYYIKKELRKN